MTQPIPFASVDFGFRSRTQHSGIEELADSIEQGLIQPIIICEKTELLVTTLERELKCQLDPTKPYLLLAGGRRYLAMEQLGVTTLEHAISSEPGRYGYNLCESVDVVKFFMVECRENLNRSDFDWRDLLRLVIRTWRLAKAEAHQSGQKASRLAFGIALGVAEADLRVGDEIYDHFILNPKLYETCDSLQTALSIRLKNEGIAVARLVAKRREVHRIHAEKMFAASQEEGVSTEPGVLTTHHVDLYSRFLHTNSLEFMKGNQAFTDHIITDPDYAISLDILDVRHNNRDGSLAQGIAQADPEQSLRELFRLIELSYFSLKEQGFLVMWYALDHHEKLQAACKAMGFAVQPWPLIWVKTDSKGHANAAANHNFPKSTEFALVARKKGTPLIKTQLSNVFSCPAGTTAKDFGHPFAKPLALWQWIYSAVAAPGQTVYDPNLGSASAACAALSSSLNPIGSEIQEENFNLGITNLQSHYRKLLGPNVSFR